VPPAAALAVERARPFNSLLNSAFSGSLPLLAPRFLLSRFTAARALQLTVSPKEAVSLSLSLSLSLSVFLAILKSENRGRGHVSSCAGIFSPVSLRKALSKRSLLRASSAEAVKRAVRAVAVARFHVRKLRYPKTI